MAKNIYFIINYPRDFEENEKDIYFEKKSIKPKCIFTKCDYDNKKYNYKKIFMFESKQEEKYKIEFVNKEDRYTISFFPKENTFIYDVILEKGLSIISVKRKISQNRIEYKEKLELFIKALEENNEEDKIDVLLNDTIELYSEKKDFNLLIPLFLKTYKKKDLCLLLMEKFKQTDQKPKINNSNRKKNEWLNNYTSQFINIINEASKIITENDYDAKDFYGIILCYLDSYDEANFSELINNLYKIYQKIYMI